MADYNLIYNSMEPGKWYKASDLGVASASMTAMVKRGLVEKKLTKPLTYCRIEASKAMRIVEFAKQDNTEFFTLYRAGTTLGMLCSVKNGTIVDCWGKPYDLTDVNRMCVYHHGLQAEHNLEN